MREAAMQFWPTLNHEAEAAAAAAPLRSASAKMISGDLPPDGKKEAKCVRDRENRNVVEKVRKYFKEINEIHQRKPAKAWRKETQTCQERENKN